MPNNAVRAAAEGLPKITRRLFMQNAVATSTASAVAAIPVVAAPGATPAVAGPLTTYQRAERVHDLAEQTAGAFDAWSSYAGGKWELRIRAADDPTPIIFRNVSSRIARDRMVSERLQKLIDDHKAAREALCAACDGIDRIALGREPSKAALRRYSKADRAEERALIAVCAYRPSGPADARAKVNYLMPFCRGGELFEQHVEALIFSEVL